MFEILNNFRGENLFEKGTSERARAGVGQSVVLTDLRVTSGDSLSSPPTRARELTCTLENRL